MSEVNKRHEGIEFEVFVSKYYINKVNSCKQSGKEFALTLTEVRNLFKIKKCQYSGVDLTHKGAGTNLPDRDRFTDTTLERVDNTIGYCKGNVLAVAHGFNQIKSTFENEQCPAEFKHLFKFAETVKKLHKSKK